MALLYGIGLHEFLADALGDAESGMAMRCCLHGAALLFARTWHQFFSIASFAQSHAVLM